MRLQLQSRNSTYTVDDFCHIYNNFNHTYIRRQNSLTLMLFLLVFKKFSLRYSRVGAGAGSNFYPEPEPYKSDAAPQH
jgi:hypothetical protein